MFCSKFAMTMTTREPRSGALELSVYADSNFAPLHETK